MKEIKHHLVEGRVDGNLEITTADEPGDGGAHHLYDLKFEGKGNYSLNRVRFQKGPIKIVGVNGVTHEALLAVIIDRLEDFQKGDYACPENEEALTHSRAALEALKKRTRDRLARGVERNSGLVKDTYKPTRSKKPIRYGPPPKKSHPWKRMVFGKRKEA